MCTKRPVAAVDQRGISLIELIVFIVIVGVALAGIAAAINYNVQHSVDPVVKKQALAIAESMLEEVMLQNYADPDGTNTGESNRSNWDDVDDYHGYTSTGIYAIDDLTTPISGLSDYTVSVQVETVASFNGISGQTKRIVVTVTGPIGTTVKLEGYRTHYAS
ncbi:MAG: prepilin-type N-terminal cleavage/methylation domain-containing protein [Methylophilaceae bacterium]|nr:prepilin-type N-terminal cleavage/methylation domain-containing protein [Methylophilaceae bacterium]